MKKKLKILKILNETKVLNISKHPGFIVNPKLITDYNTTKINKVFAKLGTSSPIILDKSINYKHPLSSMGEINWLDKNRNTKCTIAVYQKEDQYNSRIKEFSDPQKNSWNENPNFSTEQDFIKLVLLHLIDRSNCILYESRVGVKEIVLPFEFKAELIDFVLDEKNYPFNKFSEEASDYIKSLIKIKQENVSKIKGPNNSIFQLGKFDKNIKSLDFISSSEEDEYSGN